MSAPTGIPEPESPSECPKCGADLTLWDCYGEMSLEGDSIYQEVTCPNDDCDHRWSDCYHFAATIDRETGKITEGSGNEQP